MTFFRETWIVFARAMRLSLRNPVWVVIGLVQPVLYLALFGPLLKQVVGNTPGLPPGDAWQIFVPGLLVQLGIFGAAFVGFGLIAEYRAGVIERMRVTPAHRTALLVGRVARDVVVLLVQGTMLCLVAIPFGLRAPAGGVLLALLVVAFLAAAFSSLSYAAACGSRARTPSRPCSTASRSRCSCSRASCCRCRWRRRLRTLSDVNPLKHVVDGVRAFFRGDLATSTAAWGLLWAVGLVAAGVLVGTRTFRRESA